MTPSKTDLRRKIQLTLYILLFLLILNFMAMYASSWFGEDIYGLTNTRLLLSGSADLVINCKGIEYANFCLGKTVLIGVGP